MDEFAAAKQHAALRMVADYYRRRGYDVLVEPGPADRPEFLRDLRPDLIATNEDESIVVGVRDLNTSRHDANWVKIAAAVEAQPGWRFEVAMRDVALEATPEGDPEAIDRMVRDRRELERSGQLDAAFLLAWTGVEAAMRIACRRGRAKSSDGTPSTLMGALYMEGFMDEADYNLLTEKLQVWNTLVHGLKAAPTREEDVAAIGSPALRLLAESMPRRKSRAAVG